MSNPAPTRAKPRMVSVVVPVWNEEAHLGEQLDALLSQDYPDPFEIIVVDNESRDRSRSIALAKAAASSRLKVIDASRKGVSHARNVGVAAAAGDLVACCDGDDVASNTWLVSLVEQAILCDAVGGRLDSALLNTESVVAWRGVGVRRTEGLPLALGFLPYVPGGTFAIWADVLRDIGGWDEGFNGGGEDVDMSWRLQLHGYSLCHSPAALIHHRLRNTLRGAFRQRRAFGKADVMLYRKFGELGVERQTVRQSLVAWRSILISIPDLFRSPALRGNWIRRFGYRWGRLTGSISLRTRFL